MAFEGFGPQGLHIWVVGETGLGVTDLGGVSGAQDSSPAWSPTGDRLAFSRFTSPGGVPGSAIWVMNQFGANSWQLIGPGVYEAPAWSPDATEIAYNTAWQIGVVNVANGNSRVVADFSNSQLRSATWSPDGTKLAFTNFSYDWPGQKMMTAVTVMNISGTGRHDVVTSENDFVDAEPAWSPDGTQILFISNRSGTRNVWVMNPDGSGAANLTNSTFAEGGPCWSPDGNSIAFSSGRSGGSHIFKMQLPTRRRTGMLFDRYQTLTNTLATTRVGTWLMAMFTPVTDLTVGLPALICGHPTWSAVAPWRPIWHP